MCLVYCRGLGYPYLHKDRCKTSCNGHYQCPAHSSMGMSTCLYCRGLCNHAPEYLAHELRQKIIDNPFDSEYFTNIAVNNTWGIHTHTCCGQGTGDNDGNRPLHEVWKDVEAPGRYDILQYTRHIRNIWLMS